MPKSYIAFKWAVYALATLFLFGFQTLVLERICISGVRPFLYPVLPAVAAMYEGPRRGPLFAFALGFVCDLLLYGPFEGFFMITFVIIGLISAKVAENLLSQGFFGGVLLSAAALLLTGGMRVLVQALAGGAYLRLMARTAALEALVTLPAVVVVVPVYRAIHKRCAADY